MGEISSFIEKIGIFLQEKNLNIPINTENISRELIINEAILLVVSIVGWAIAKAFARGVKDAIEKSNFFKNIFVKLGINISVRSFAELISSVIFISITFAGLIIALKYISLEIGFLREIIDNLLYTQLPRFGWIILIIIGAFLLASILKTVITKIVKNFNLSEKLGINIEWLGIVGYWGVILFFIPVFLKRIGNQDLLNPVNNRIEDISVYIPNISESFVIAFVGIIFARFLQKIVERFIEINGTEKISEKLKIKGEYISKYSGKAVYTVVLLITIVIALNNLKIDTIRGSINDISGSIDKGIQSIINFTNGMLNASIMILISFVIGRIISDLIIELLTKLNFDRVLDRLGLSKINLKITPSKIAGNTFFAYMMMIVSIEAFDIIGIDRISSILITIFWFLNKMLFLFLIFVLGLYLSNLLDKKIRIINKSEVLPIVAKICVMFITGLLLFLIY